MADLAKVLAIGAGVGLAIYGIVQLCKRKCKRCGE